MQKNGIEGRFVEAHKKCIWNPQKETEYGLYLSEF